LIAHFFFLATGPPTSDFFDDLAANATARGVPIVFVAGNNDMVVPPWGTEGTRLPSFCILDY
jgi:hypothetical protein